MSTLGRRVNHRVNTGQSPIGAGRIFLKMFGTHASRASLLATPTVVNAENGSVVLNAGFNETVNSTEKTPFCVQRSTLFLLFFRNYSQY